MRRIEFHYSRESSESRGGWPLVGVAFALASIALTLAIHFGWI